MSGNSYWQRNYTPLHIKIGTHTCTQVSYEHKYCIFMEKLPWFSVHELQVFLTFWFQFTGQTQLMCLNIQKTTVPYKHIHVTCVNLNTLKKVENDDLICFLCIHTGTLHIKVWYKYWYNYSQKPLIRLLLIQLFCNPPKKAWEPFFSLI